MSFIISFFNIYKLDELRSLVVSSEKWNCITYFTLLCLLSYIKKIYSKYNSHMSQHLVLFSFSIFTNLVVCGEAWQLVQKSRSILRILPGIFVFCISQNQNYPVLEICSNDISFLIKFPFIFLNRLSYFIQFFCCFTYKKTK